MNIRQDVARRIAARILRAHEAGVLDIDKRERNAMASVVTSSFVTPRQRADLVARWRVVRLELDAAEWTDPRPSKLDAQIAAL